MGRWKKTLRWVEISLGMAVALALLTNACLVWITDAWIEQQLAQMRAEGDPTSLLEWAQRRIPPEQNAATYLRQAAPDVNAIYATLRQVPGALAPLEGLDAPQLAQVQRVVRKVAAAHPQAFPLLEQAAACPDYHPDLDYPMPPIESLERAVTVSGNGVVFLRVFLYGRAMPLAVEGKHDEAMRVVLQAFRLAHHFDRMPMLIPYLTSASSRGAIVDVANYVLQSGPVSGETRNALDAELAGQERMEAYNRAMRTQRAFFLDEFATFENRNDWLLSRIIWNQQELDCLDTWQFFMDRSSDLRPYNKVVKVVDNTPQKAWGVGAGALPSLLAAQRTVTQVRAKLRALRVLNAAQRYERAHDNRLPALSELALPAQTTMDPFTGAPLQIKRFPEGWLVYSVGADYEDEGGGKHGLHHDDVGVQPPRWRSMFFSLQ